MKTMRFFSMAALALVGAMMTGCTNDDNFIDEPQQPANTDNIVTMTTTISLDDGEPMTRALTAAGVKTFVAGEQIAVVYENTSSEMVKVESVALEDGDIANEGKTATFTVTLTNPKESGEVKYIYPAAMAKDDGSINYDALATQDGTLETLASNLDFAMYEGSLTASAGLPASPTLTNQLAILALTLKTIDGNSEVTGSITSMNITDGTNSYTVTRSAAEGPIYVAIRPTSSANIDITATDGADHYYNKFLVNKTYAASNGYSISLRMGLAGNALSGQFTINSAGTKVRFSQGNLQAIWDGKSWTWRFAPNQYDYIGNTSGNTHINGDGTLSAAGTVDLFGWVGASNNTWTGVAKYGISNSTTNSAYGNVNQEPLKSDWGNAIGPGWRTLVAGYYDNEWRYLLTERAASTVYSTANTRYAKATVVGSPGMILFPDSYEHPSGISLNHINESNADYNANSYNPEDWGKMEAAGAVFLPAAGRRSGAEVPNAGASALYWTAELAWTEIAVNILFTSSSLVDRNQGYRFYGNAVRLVREVK